MSYQPKKYIYMAVGGYYGRFTIGVYASKKEAVKAAQKWEKETDVEAWVERHKILKSADQEPETKSYHE